jgi:hypothetical protein
MNKKQIVTSLNKIADLLDNTGLYKEANTITKIMSRLAMDENDEYNTEDYGYCPDCGDWIGDYDYCIECDWNVEKDDDVPDFGDIDFYDFIDVDFGEEEMPTKYTPEKPGKNK